MRKDETFFGRFFNRTAPPLVSGTGGRGSLLMPSLFSRGNREKQMQTMGAVGTLFSVVNTLSNGTAQVEWKLWRKSQSGRVEDREPVTEHAALSVWEKPNDFYTRQEFVESIQQHVDLVGETEWFVARDENFPQAGPLGLWPIRPDRIEPVPHPTRFLAGWIYKGPDGEQIPLSLDEVISLRMPNPMDPIRGMGPVQALMADLDSDKFSAEWNRNFFLNGAEPGGIIEVEKRLSDPEFTEMNQRWIDQHKGVSKAHRVAILEQGKWKDRQFSQRDMQFSQLRTLSRDKVMEAYGVSKFALGIVDDVNRATAEASEVVHAHWKLVPRLERIKQALNHDFLPMFGTTGKGLEFDYVNPVPPDRAADNNELTAKGNFVAALVAQGFDPAATLSAVGLPEIPWVGRRETENANV